MNVRTLSLALVLPSGSSAGVQSVGEPVQVAPPVDPNVSTPSLRISVSGTISHRGVFVVDAVQQPQTHGNGFGRNESLATDVDDVDGTVTVPANSRDAAQAARCWWPTSANPGPPANLLPHDTFTIYGPRTMRWSATAVQS
jgi:hypothetical protein